MTTAKELAEKLYAMAEAYYEEPMGNNLVIDRMQSLLETALRDTEFETAKAMENLIREAILAERERCAKIAENFTELSVSDKVCSAIAQAIRHPQEEK